jgi:short-subunit dehydrogenase
MKSQKIVILRKAKIKLNKQTILITGASSGLGCELAIQYSNPNSRLILMGRNSTQLNKIANLCEDKGAKRILSLLI